MGFSITLTIRSDRTAAGGVVNHSLDSMEFSEEFAEFRQDGYVPGLLARAWLEKCLVTFLRARGHAVDEPPARE